MKAARAVFIWKAVSGDSTTMRTGAERIGTGRTGSEGTGTEPTGIERIGIEQIGIEQIGIEVTWSEGTWAIGTSQIASATIVEGLRASMANGTLKATPAESLNSSQCPTAFDKKCGHKGGEVTPSPSRHRDTKAPPTDAALGNVEVLEGRRAQLGRVAHSSLSYLDDSLGNNFGDRVVPFRELENFQCCFVSRGETFDGFPVERLPLQ
jgi:hypothetical protein